MDMASIFLVFTSCFFFCAVVAEDDCTLHTSLLTSPEDKQLLVDLHNKLRRQEGSSDMVKMSYNETLADRAQVVADSCIWAHDYTDLCGQHIGQNLYLRYGDDFSMLNLTQVMMDWYNEKYDYNFDTDECDEGKICGHYKQVVLSGQYELGCAIQVCPNIEAGGNVYSNGIFFACDYSATVYKDEQVHKKGPACSDCSHIQPGFGSRCDNGLCEKCNIGTDADCQCTATTGCQNYGTINTATCTCECTGYYGPYCSEPCCKDLIAHCEYYAAHNYCSHPHYGGYMSLYCQETCDFCNGIEIPDALPAGVCGQ